jgi:hypothetical protein
MSRVKIAILIILKLRLSTIALTLITLLFYTSKSFAVDGYQNITFGMTAEEVLSSDICSFEKQPQPVDGADFYACFDFDFNGQQVEAGFFTVNEEFQRFYFEVPIDSAVAVLNSLTSRFGQYSSNSTREEFEAVDRIPNRQAFYGFDNDTVFLQISSLEDLNQLVVVIYTSTNYEELRAKVISENIDGLF